MTDDIWPVIHTERRALAADLASVAPEQWRTPSMCQGWTVHQVLAHMVAVACTSPVGFVRKLGAAGFSFPRAQDRGIADESAGGPSATLQRFRQVEASTAAPPGPRLSWLGETLVHADDIRRPLGLAHQYPTSQVTRLLDFYARSNLPVGARRRIRGLSLAATDTDWQRGHGPLVEGPAMSLLMEWRPPGWCVTGPVRASS